MHSAGTTVGKCIVGTSFPPSSPSFLSFLSLRHLIIVHNFKRGKKSIKVFVLVLWLRNCIGIGIQRAWLRKGNIC